ncbi:MAG: alpha/beta hydrolase [Firmicutes bacterium]|jgi:pimeloyl-ACP methyl ester carboxylesterase|nr:alpha/beta hydrolase [Bacillota bacterium]
MDNKQTVSSDRLIVFPGIGFVAKMFVPLAKKLNPNLSTYGINWPFHAALPTAHLPRPEVRDEDVFLEQFVTTEELAKYVLFALSLITGSECTQESKAAGLLKIDTLSENARKTSSQPIGFGHSAGATALLACESLYPGTFSALFLYEALFITDFAAAPREVNDEILSLVTRTPHRRSAFASPEEAKSHFGSRMPFASMDETCLDLYVRESLQHDNDSSQGFRLILDKETEAKFYSRFAEIGGISELPRPSCPVYLMTGSEAGRVAAHSLSNMKNLIPDSRVLVLDGLDHFGPFSAPMRMAEVLNELLPLYTGKPDFT